MNTCEQLSRAVAAPRKKRSTTQLFSVMKSLPHIVVVSRPVLLIESMVLNCSVDRSSKTCKNSLAQPGIQFTGNLKLIQAVFLKIWFFNVVYRFDLLKN